MRKDEPYMKRNGRSLGHGLCLIVVLCLLLAACTNDEDVLPGTDETCRATLCLNVSSFGAQETDGATRSVAANSDESYVKDLWVFQFSSKTDSLLKEPVYINEEKLNGNTDDITIDFMPNGPNENSYVCVVANTHDANWATDENDQTRKGFDTYTEFKKQALPAEVSQPFLSSNMGETGGYTIPMYGENQLLIASKTYIRVPLVRMFAKVDVSVDPSYPYAHNMTIKSITYSNIPIYSRITEMTAEEYPDTVWEDLEMGNSEEYILYIPENMQGVVEEITTDKLTADPALIPPHALAINVYMTHTTMAESDDEEADTHVHEYTVYPGMDMKNDFNVKRNYIYNVTIKLKSEPHPDTIVDDEEEP